MAGKLLKKKLLKTYEGLEIEPFPWALLDNSTLAVPDNTRNSVILANLHVKEELKEKVKDAVEFKQVLQPKGNVMQPIDLTNDFNRSQDELRFKKRRKMLDEDEAVALEIAEIIERGGAEMAGSWKDKEHKKKKDAAAEAKTEEKDKAQDNIQDKNLGKNGDESGAKKEQKPKVEPPVTSAHPLKVEKSHKEEMGKEYERNMPDPHSNALDLEALKQQIWDEAFAAGLEEGLKSAEQNENIERESSSGQNPAEQDDGSLERELENLKKEAFESAYTEGFRVGEEKGELAGESKAVKITTTMEKMVEEIGKVRGEILFSGQEIFVEIVKLACEKILRAQIAVDDNTLKQFLTSALTPFLERPLINVDVAPDLLEKAKNAFTQAPNLQNKVKLKANQALPSGNFRFEAANEVTIVDLHKAVDELVEELKADIFSSQDSAMKKEAA